MKDISDRNQMVELKDSKTSLHGRRLLPSQRRDKQDLRAKEFAGVQRSGASRRR